MSFEPNYDRVVSNYINKIGEMQSQIECKLQVMEGKEVKEILCTNVSLSMITGNVMQNAINIEETSNVQVFYETMDGEFLAEDYTLEFKDKFVTDKELMLADTIISGDVIDVRASVDNGAIKVVAILNITIDGVFADNHNVLVSTTSNDVFVKYEDETYCNFVGVASEKFDYSFDIEINDAVDHILAVSPKAVVTNVESQENYIKVFGEVVTTVTYVTAGERADIRTLNVINDFNQEIALQGVTDKSVVISSVACVYQDVSITTNLGEDKSILNMIVPIMYKGYVWQENTIQEVRDIYSTTNEIIIDSKPCSRQNCLPPKVFVERVNGVVSLEDSDPVIDEVLGTNCSNVVIANKQIVGDNVVVDGIVSTTVIYKTGENLRIVSYEVQVPFSLELNMGEISSECEIIASAFVERLQVKARRGSDIELNADIVVSLSLCKISVANVICEARLSENLRVLDSNLVIYITKPNDTIWDIAKEMGVAEEIILAQNPKLDLPITPGTRVVIYRQKCAKL